MTACNTPIYVLKKEYDRLFACNPLAANVFLLLFEMADENGQVRFNGNKAEREILQLLRARFNNPKEYQL